MAQARPNYTQIGLLTKIFITLYQVEALKVNPIKIYQAHKLISWLAMSKTDQVSSWRSQLQMLSR